MVKFKTVVLTKTDRHTCRISRLVNCASVKIENIDFRCGEVITTKMAGDLAEFSDYRTIIYSPPTTKPDKDMDKILSSYITGTPRETLINELERRAGLTGTRVSSRSFGENIQTLSKEDESKLRREMGQPACDKPDNIFCLQRSGMKVLNFTNDVTGLMRATLKERGAETDGILWKIVSHGPAGTTAKFYHRIVMPAMGQHKRRTTDWLVTLKGRATAVAQIVAQFDAFAMDNITDIVSKKPPFIEAQERHAVATKHDPAAAKETLDDMMSNVRRAAARRVARAHQPPGEYDIIVRSPKGGVFKTQNPVAAVAKLTYIINMRPITKEQLYWEYLPPSSSGRYRLRFVSKDESNPVLTTLRSVATISYGVSSPIDADKIVSRMEGVLPLRDVTGRLTAERFESSLTGKVIRVWFAHLPSDTRMKTFQSLLEAAISVEDIFRTGSTVKWLFNPDMGAPREGLDDRKATFFQVTQAGGKPVCHVEGHVNDINRLAMRVTGLLIARELAKGA